LPADRCHIEACGIRLTNSERTRGALAARDAAFPIDASVQNLSIGATVQKGEFVSDRRKEVFARADALAFEFRARATESETNRTMPADLAAKVKKAGLFRLSLPASLGGWEADPITIFEVIEKLSYADGSAGWTTLIGCSPVFMAWLDPEVAAGLLDGNPDICTTGMFAPLGQAVPNGEGAFTVVGRWPYNSGCPHSEWFVAGVVVKEGDRPRIVPPGRPDWRLAWFPCADGKIIDNWDAAGLKGTGSHDIAVDGATVPEALTCCPMFDPPRHAGPLYRLSFYNLISVHMAGFSAGVGRRALDEFVATAEGKHRGPSATLVADDPVIQHRFAIVDGDLRAARAFFNATICEAWEKVTRGDPCSLQQRALVMSATQVLQRAALAAVDAVLPFAGASAVYAENPIQRCSRDLHAASQHIFFNVDVLKDIGRVALGRTPTSPRF
jgi:indole-3-acetate monooxygenase